MLVMTADIPIFCVQNSQTLSDYHQPSPICTYVLIDDDRCPKSAGPKNQEHQLRFQQLCLQFVPNLAVFFLPNDQFVQCQPWLGRKWLKRPWLPSGDLT